MRLILKNSLQSEIVAGIEDDNYTLDLTLRIVKNNSEHHGRLSLTGRDHKFNRYEWINGELNPFENQLEIKIVTDENISATNAKVTQDEAGFVEDQMVKYYYKLQSELKEKGLI